MTNKEKYLNLCEHEPSICIYDQPWWMDAVCGKENWDVFLCEEDGEIQGAMPYCIKKKLELTYITQPPFTQHNGPWIKQVDGHDEYGRLSLEKKVMNDLIESLESKDICFYQQCFNPKITNWQPFYWHHYSQTTRYTYIINDISDTQHVFEKFHSTKRRNIRKAQKNELVFKTDISAYDFYQLHKSSLKSYGDQISYSYEIFERIYNAAIDQKKGKTFAVYNQSGKLLCALFNIWDHYYTYHLISAIDPEGRSLCALDYAVWNVIQYFSDIGIRAYDFEGSMIENVEESYRKFGATQTPYFSVHKMLTRNSIIRYAIERKMRYINT